jgi:hypothetical protein
MLIKKAVGGEPIPYSPSEALPYAVEYGVKSLNTQDSVHWTLKKSVESGDMHHVTVPQNNRRYRDGWEATATGTVMIGKTCTKTDRFFEPRKHSFSIKYKSSVDELGLPDLEIVSFKTELISTNPLDALK